MRQAKKLGLIINPIAGMGGKVGLKGTDGPEILARAIDLGAVPQAQERAQEALRQIITIQTPLNILTFPGTMGELAVRSAGLTPSLLSDEIIGQTLPEDTKRAAALMQQAGVDLLLFVGGDGTARDVYSVVGENMICLGIPAGVKIHSAVFSLNPAIGGRLASEYLMGRIREVRACEVMDIDETEYRRGNLSSRLFGYLSIPYKKQHSQNQKMRTPAHERYDQQAVAADIAAGMRDSLIYMVGPGTTTRMILEALDQPASLLGVDVVRNRVLVARDADESKLLAWLQPGNTRLILTPVGGQGYILGRGNQQISPQILCRLSKKDIIIAATPQKIWALQGAALRVDTGDVKVDHSLSGYYRVVTGRGESIIYRVCR